MGERIQGQIRGAYVVACLAVAPGLVVSDDPVEDFAGTSAWRRRMLNAVALALVTAEVGRRSTET